MSQPVDGGVANVVTALANDQMLRGWSPMVACPPEGELPERMRADCIPLAPWDAARSPGLRVPAEVRALKHIVARTQPDVVHLHGSKAGLAGRLAIRGKTPTIFQPHLWSFESEPGPTAAPSLVWERFASRWTDAFICVSEDERNTGQSAGIPGRHVVIRNGINVAGITHRSRHEAREELQLDPYRPIVACVGRLAPLKGQDMLLHAWPGVLDQVSDACLVLVGDGPLRSKLQAEHPIASNPSVNWIGWSTRTLDYMAAANVVVVPSRAEGMALVPLEAMACGRSVVAFDAGGIRESVGDCGVVLSVGDVDGLATEITRRLKNPTEADQEGACGRHRVETEFDMRRTAQSVAAIVEELGRQIQNGH